MFAFISFPLRRSDSYLLTVGLDSAGLLEAALAALRIRFPLAGLCVHVQELTATEHGNLWLCHLGAWPVHLSHGQSLESKRERGGGKTDEEESIQNTVAESIVSEKHPRWRDHR